MADLSKATPRPWEWKLIDGYSHLHAADGGSHFGDIATIWSPSEANAALIVKCVNLHDELVAALRAVVPIDFDKHPGDFMPEWHRARAVLAKAEAE